MNDKIKTQIIGACVQQGVNSEDAKHIAVSVLNSLQPQLSDAARFRMIIYAGIHQDGPEAQMIEEITGDLPEQDLTDDQIMTAIVQAIDAVREKFGDRP